MAKKDNYLGARLTDEAINFLKKDFEDNLSKGIQVSINVYRNVVLLALVDIQKQNLTESEIKALMMIKNLNQSLDDATLNLVSQQNGVNPTQLRKKIGALGRIEKYVMFEQLGLYGIEKLKERFAAVD